jgi:hypothetical protein
MTWSRSRHRSWIGRRSLAAAVVLTLGCVAGPVAAQTIFENGFEDGTGCGWSAVVIATETFPADGAAWPAAWSVAGGVDTADVAGGRGRLRPAPTNYSLGRMKASVPTRDVEVNFTLVFEQQSTQGVGFYVRQNGGYLQQTNPNGQGYAIFVEGFRGFPRLGLWKEQGGVETELAFSNLAQPYVDGLVYAARFRVFQQSASTTHLYGKVWLASDPEPADWIVDVADSSVAALQGTTGGIAVDSWSSLQNPPLTFHTFVDNVAVIRACPEN